MTVLCIDDDPDEIEVFQDAIATIDANHRCVAAFNGQEALNTLESLQPDYIILDINMPVMDGKETLIRIRGDGHHHTVPVCVLSTALNPNDVLFFKKFGAHFCFEKPGSFDELVAILRTALEQAPHGD